MTTPVEFNPISMADVATELGVSSTGLNLDASNVRTLAGVGASPATISFHDLHGKTA